MNRCKVFLLGVMIFFGLQTMCLFAAEEDAQAVEISEEDADSKEGADAIGDAVHNQFLLENIRLIELADKSYADAQYDSAIEYAQEAIKYAQLSDDYVSFMAAQNRMAWAEKTGAPKNYPEIYGKAQTAFADAQDAHSRDDWEAAGKSARQVLAILSELPDQPVYPAQYLVKNWNPMKDCLWNIAARPEIYNDPHQWRVIYNANKQKFPKPDDPNILEPGMILDIPSIKGETRFGVLE